MRVNHPQSDTNLFCTPCKFSGRDFESLMTLCHAVFIDNVIVKPVLLSRRPDIKRCTLLCPLANVLFDHACLLTRPRLGHSAFTDQDRPSIAGPGYISTVSPPLNCIVTEIASIWLCIRFIQTKPRFRKTIIVDHFYGKFIPRFRVDEWLISMISHRGSHRGRQGWCEIHYRTVGAFWIRCVYIRSINARCVLVRPIYLFYSVYCQFFISKMIIDHSIHLNIYYIYSQHSFVDTSSSFTWL